MVKSADAFRTIREVSDILNTPAHVLRFWETKFSQIKPVKRAGGRRYYRRSDVNLIAGIKKLLHGDGVTIRGVQKILREQGVNHVAEITSKTSNALAQPEDVTKPPELAKTSIRPAIAIDAASKNFSPQELPANVKKATSLASQISLFDELPLSEDPSTKPANKHKTHPDIETGTPSHLGEGDQIDLRTDDNIVPEIAAQLSQHTAVLENESAPNWVSPLTEKPKTTGEITTATAISGPLHYLSQVGDLRPLQQEQLPKLRDMLSEIFHGEE